MTKRDVLLIAISVLISVLDMEWYNQPQKDAAHAVAVSSEIPVTAPVQRPVFHSGSSAPINFVNAAQIGLPAVVRISTTASNQLQFWKSNNVQYDGSGVIISSDGYIVTNNHVVSKGSTYSVELYDRNKYTATLVGADPSSDLAVLKIDQQNLPFVDIANSDSVKVGEFVIAIGNPYHLNSTVTSGIVSAKGRTIDLLKGSYTFESFIQTDAVVNTGNSGGALLNEKGQLIGLNTAIFTQTGKFEGYSFAIPSNIVRKITLDIIDFGKVQRGILGIGIENLTDQMAKNLKIQTYTGVYVNRVSEGSAAKLGGLQVGDVITHVNNTHVSTYNQLQEQIALSKPGDVVDIRYLRKQKEVNTKLTLASPFNTNTNITVRADKSLKDLGFELREMDIDEINESGHHGVLVHSIFKNSRLASTSIEPGFILTKVNGKSVKTVDEVIAALQKITGKIELYGFYNNYPNSYTYYLTKKSIGL